MPFPSADPLSPAICWGFLIKVSAAGLICISSYLLRAQMNTINSSSDWASRRIKTGGGGWCRVSLFLLGGGQSCHAGTVRREGVSVQDHELRCGRV